MGEEDLPQSQELRIIVYYQHLIDINITTGESEHVPGMLLVEYETYFIDIDMSAAECEYVLGMLLIEYKPNHTAS